MIAPSHAFHLTHDDHDDLHEAAGDVVRTAAAPSVDQARIARAVREILAAVGEDPDRDGLLDTPKRVAKAYAEMFSGLRQDASDHLARTFEQASGQLITVTNINFFSVCEHHLLPFHGQAHVAYVPNHGRVVGLSKLARVVDIYSKRLQVQEKLTAQIANAINTTLRPHGVAVVIQARHFCMCYRGVRQPGAVTTTSKLHGSFLTNPAARMELFTLLSLKPE